MKNLSKNKINKVGEPIEKVGMDDERIFGITKLKMQAFSLAALKMILGDIVVKVSSVMERTSIQIATYSSGYI